MQWPPPRPRPSSEPSMRQHFDARLAQSLVGVFVLRIGDHDAGLDGDQVVAVVPLLALGLVLVAAGADDAQLGTSSASATASRKLFSSVSSIWPALSDGRRL